MMSSRYATAVVILALIALGPTVVHNYVKIERRDALAAATLAPASARQTESTRQLPWFREHFAAFDAVDREVATAGGSVRLSIVRTFDAKALYHHPENTIAYGRALHRHDLIQLPELPEVTVHRLRTDPGSGETTALYLLWWDGEFVGNPVRYQAQQMLGSLVRGRTPATLVFVQPGLGARPTESDMREVLAGIARTLLGA